MKYLTSGLIAEDESDISFLSPLLQAELLRIALAEGFDAGQIQLCDVPAVKSAGTVAKAAAELLGSCHILFVHRDYREAAKVDALRDRLGAENRVVGVVPVRETEAWALAAACSTAYEIPQFDSTAPERGLKWVERLDDPKAELRRRYRGRRSVEDLFTLIAERTDLDRLAEVPAYQSFLLDLTKALKELNFS